jgi:hypothetical protein
MENNTFFVGRARMKTMNKHASTTLGMLAP